MYIHVLVHLCLQKLQESLQQFDEQNKAVLQTIQKIEATKKEKDAKVTLEALEGQLQGALQNIKQVTCSKKLDEGLEIPYL